MSKVHINDDGEVKPCSASLKDCRFGADTHFDNVEDAQFEADRRHNEEYGEFATQTKSNRRIEREEYPPTVVDNAVSEEELAELKADSDHKVFKKYNETIELYKNLKITSKVEQEMSYMLEDIVGDGKDDMMSDDGIMDHLYEWGASDNEDTSKAADKLLKMLKN